MNKPLPAEDTIAAIATGACRSAIGILRLSGPEAIAAVEQVFTPFSGEAFSRAEPRKLVFGELRDREGKVIDQCLATLSRAPHSYTGEDCCELQCHGSPAVLSAGLEALFAHGVRQARAGEFTKRAFLNGRMDLTQAEAVIDLIDAQSAAAARNAAGQLSGAVSRQIDAIYNELLNVSAHFDAVLDYADEDLEPFEITELSKSAEEAILRLNRLLSTVQRGRQLTEGIPCALVGAPNAGKSSLLNALLGYDRAIVTDQPGTTRDTLQETLNLGGVLLRLTDTAGLRDSADQIEQLGVARSRQAAAQAELTLAVVDGSVPLSREGEEALALAEQSPKAVCVVNKSDLGCALELAALRERFSLVCPVSAVTGEGLEALERCIARLFSQGAEPPAGELLTNLRQAQCAERARDSLLRVREGLSLGVTPDALLTDVEEALQALGELTGRSVTEDITSRIFERFCVGK